METENQRSMWGIIVVVLLVLLFFVFILVQNNNATNTNTSVNQPVNNNTPDPVVGNTTDMTNDNLGGTDGDNSNVTPTAPVTFELTEQNGSGQNGTIVLEEIDGSVRATLTLTNPVATPEPAHIHVGRCPNPGAVVYGLTDVVNGSSVTMIDATLSEIRAQGDLAVNVHKSAAESDVYVSCGNIDL